MNLPHYLPALLSTALMSVSFLLIMLIQDGSSAFFFFLMYVANASAWIYRGPSWRPILALLQAAVGGFVSLFISFIIYYPAHFMGEVEWLAIFCVMNGTICLIGTRRFWTMVLLWSLFAVGFSYLLDWALPDDFMPKDRIVFLFAALLYAFSLLQILKSYLELRRDPTQTPKQTPNR
jgi:hypothetical protein